MRSSTLPRVLVTGAGGFIGNHLVTALKQRGYWVRGADTSPPEYAMGDADEFEAHPLEAARVNGASRCLFSSSACVYPDHLQAEANVAPLTEEDAYPASPQDAYGWEELVAERLCQYYTGEFGLETRVVRFHDIYGPSGTCDGGREKVAVAEPGGEIEVWGDGEQTRSFCYVDDCVEGIYRLMQSESGEPLNLGSDETVTVNELARMIIDVSGKDGITLRHIGGPQGVRGRKADNRRLLEVLGWEPSVTLRQGLEPTYRWIEQQVLSRRPLLAATGG